MYGRGLQREPNAVDDCAPCVCPVLTPSFFKGTSRPEPAALSIRNGQGTGDLCSGLVQQRARCTAILGMWALTVAHLLRYAGLGRACGIRLPITIVGMVNGQS